MGGLNFPPETHVRVAIPADPQQLRNAQEDYWRTLRSNATAPRPRTSGMTNIRQAEALHRYLAARNPYRVNRGTYGEESPPTPRRGYTVTARGFSSDPS
jgi:hypothetical protein